MCQLLEELGAHLTQPPHIWCDNIGAVFLSSNSTFQARTCHVEVDFHFVRHWIMNKAITVAPISSNDQLANVLTKPLPKQRMLH